MPVEPVLVELDHDLRYLDVGLLGWHQVGLLGPFPLDEEEELSRFVGCTNNLLWLESPGKPSRLLLRLTVGWRESCKECDGSGRNQLLTFRLCLGARWSLPPGVSPGSGSCLGLQILKLGLRL